MNWVKYNTPHKDVGTLVSVWIDEEAGLIKRVFNGDHCGEGTGRFANMAGVFFENEVRWLSHLHSKWVPYTHIVNHETKTLIQDYYGPSLLHYHHDKKWPIPDLSDQIIDLYKFFKEKGVHKLNGAMANMTVNGDQLIAFDFKWARPAPKGLRGELNSYTKWLSKIDSKLPKELERILLS